MEAPHSQMMMRKERDVLTAVHQYARVCLSLSFESCPLVPAHFYIGGGNAVRTLAEFIGGCDTGRIYASLQPEG